MEGHPYKHARERTSLGMSQGLAKCPWLMLTWRGGVSDRVALAPVPSTGTSHKHARESARTWWSLTAEGALTNPDSPTLKQ